MSGSTAPEELSSQLLRSFSGTIELHTQRQVPLEVTLTKQRVSIEFINFSLAVTGLMASGSLTAARIRRGVVGLGLENSPQKLDRE